MSEDDKHVPAPAVSSPPVDAAIETTIETPIETPIEPMPIVEPPPPPAVDMKLTEPEKPKPTKRPIKKQPARKR
jgi:hypothetical protein